MVSWALEFSEQAVIDANTLAAHGLKPKAQELLVALARDPLAPARAADKLMGQFAGTYSRRINFEHRMIFEVFEKERAIRVLRMWTPKQRGR